MRKKLLGISALTCLIGGTMLVAPATSQATPPSCDGTIGTYCPRNGATSGCEMLPGQYEPMVCWNHRWTLA